MGTSQAQEKYSLNFTPNFARADELQEKKAGRPGKDG